MNAEVKTDLYRAVRSHRGIGVKGGCPKIKTFIDFCAGIGGFRLGLKQVGFKCIGFCEKDKFAVKSYKAMHNTEGEWFSDDIDKLKASDIPRADIWTFGFPCQDVSIAGKQLGLSGKRSGIYYRIIDLVKGKEEEAKPTYLLVENVKNLLSINEGWDFADVLAELDKAGYDAQWQVLNSKDFGVPQNRERVFIIGYLRGRSRGEILPINGENSGTTKKIADGSQALSVTLNAQRGGLGVRSRLYFVNQSIYGKHKISDCCQTLKARDYKGPVMAVLTPDRLDTRQNGRRFKGENEPMFTLTGQDRHGVALYGRIRRLTPRECWRLQGFSDELFEKAKAVNSDAQLYKQAGNAVTVNVVRAIAEMLIEKED